MREPLLEIFFLKQFFGEQSKKSVQEVIFWCKALFLFTINQIVHHLNCTCPWKVVFGVLELIGRQVSPSV
uniref:Uncharacterized protein n=1 Tax=Anguilla anguilla TaxID=7936 RepID=A0A0E9WQD4_ANGAN